jgi:hypothetical protein
MLDRDEPCRLLSRIAYDRHGLIRWLEVDRLLAIAEEEIGGLPREALQP